MAVPLSFGDSAPGERRENQSQDRTRDSFGQSPCSWGCEPDQRAYSEPRELDLAPTSRSTTHHAPEAFFRLTLTSKYHAVGTISFVLNSEQKLVASGARFADTIFTII